MQVLHRDGYLGKRYDKRARLAGTPIVYYLTPKGLRQLQALPDHDYVTDKVIKASYRDATLSEAFLTYTRFVYQGTNQLRRHYPALKVFTQRDMAQEPYFPATLPDAFLSLPAAGQQPHRYFFDLIDAAQPPSVLNRRLAVYRRFFESGGWEVTGSQPPVILLVGETAAVMKRIVRAVRWWSPEFATMDVTLYISTLDSLVTLGTAPAIWSDPADLADKSELDQ